MKPWSLRSCPLCSESSNSTLLGFRHPAVADTRALQAAGIDLADEFSIVECSGCGFIYANRLLNEESYRRRYELLTNHEKALESIQAKERYLSLLRDWVKVVAYCLEDKRTSHLEVLDYGCGFGDFCRMADSLFINCYGVELDARKAAYATKHGVEVLANATDRQPYDLICLHEVLEHVPDPVETIRTLRRMLKRGGSVWVTVSINFDGLKPDIESGPPYRKSLNPWEHLNYFTKASLRRLFVAEGFQLGVKLEDTRLVFRATD